MSRTTDRLARLGPLPEVTFFRVVLRDVNTGKLVSVRSDSPVKCLGMEPGDEILEAVPQNVTKGRALSADERASLPSAMGFEVVSAFQLPVWSDAVTALNPVELAPWAEQG